MALAVEQADVDLTRGYDKKIGRMLATTKVARDIRTRAAVRAELAAQIPLVYYAHNPGGSGFDGSKTAQSQ